MELDAEQWGRLTVRNALTNTQTLSPQTEVLIGGPKMLLCYSGSRGAA
jgi:hypothetical protein